MRLAMFLPPQPNEVWRLAVQLGVTDAVSGLPQIHFVHFRDIRGTASRFVETFQDNGPTDMLEVMRCYQEIGFDGPIRPDHVPTLEGDDNITPGYTTRGRLYAIGYMRGLMEAVQKGM